jgi:hypothetical protein
LGREVTEWMGELVQRGCEIAHLRHLLGVSPLVEGRLVPSEETTCCQPSLLGEEEPSACAARVVDKFRHLFNLLGEWVRRLSES